MVSAHSAVWCRPTLPYGVGPHEGCMQKLVKVANKILPTYMLLLQCFAGQMSRRDRQYTAGDVITLYLLLPVDNSLAKHSI